MPGYAAPSIGEPAVVVVSGDVGHADSDVGAGLRSRPQAAADALGRQSRVELRYFTVADYAAMPHVAPGSMLVFRHLQALDLVD